MKPAILMKGIKKTYPGGIVALRGVDFEVSRGEIHALVGENGAGKTTLMNILYGLVRPDSGAIEINGERCSIKHPRDAISKGIGMVHQHFMLIQELTVLENIVIGFEKTFKKAFGRIDYRSAEEVVRSLLEDLRMDLPLSARVEDIPIGYKQRVEIVKALFRGADILILDEPTSVLAPVEIADFLNFLKHLKSMGKTVVFISHKLNEVFEVADRITILRKGENVGVFKTEEVSQEDVARLMIGEKLQEIPKITKKSAENEPLLVIKNLNYIKHGKRFLRDVNLIVNRGEIVGIAGVEGNGQDELSRAIIGLLDVSKGEIYLDGEDITRASVNRRRKLGMSYIPPDRKEWGFAVELSIVKNCAVNFIEEISDRLGRIRWSKARIRAESIVRDFDVRGVSDVKKPVSSLSGGNMQKLLVGRECSTNPKFLLVFQPTAGVDLQAQRLIHSKLLGLKDKGVGILLISFDLEELFLLSDRLYVMFNGELVKEFSGRYDVNEISACMTGVKIRGER